MVDIEYGSNRRKHDLKNYSVFIFRVLQIGTLAGILFLLLTCGKKGNPLPPLIIAPQPPSNAKVRQSGDLFVYFFQMPTLSTDNKTPPAVGKMVIYRLREARIAAATPASTTQSQPASQTQTAPQTQTQTAPSGKAQTQTQGQSTVPQTQSKPSSQIPLKTQAQTQTQMTQTQTQSQTQTRAQTQTQTQSQSQTQTQSQTQSAPAREEEARTLTDKDFEHRAEKIAEIPETQVPAYIRDNYFMLIDKFNAASGAEDFKNWTYYAVKIYNKKGKSPGLSKLVALYPDAVPKAPSQFTARFSERQIEFTWSPVVYDIHGQKIPTERVTYNIYRGNHANFAPQEPLNSEAITMTSYVDTTFQFGQPYYYFLRAHLNTQKKGQESAPSNIILIYPQDTFPPSAPQELNVVAAKEGMVLIWTPNPEQDVAGYNVYRSLQSGSGFEKINGEVVRETTYTDSKVQAGKTYYYVITAVDSAPVPNESPKSTEVSETARKS